MHVGMILRHIGQRASIQFKLIDRHPSGDANQGFRHIVVLVQIPRGPLQTGLVCSSIDISVQKSTKARILRKDRVGGLLWACSHQQPGAAIWPQLILVITEIKTESCRLGPPLC